MKIFFTLLTSLLSLSLLGQGTQLLRQPTISNDEVVFVYANDLWKASVNGGQAIRLTSNEGYELAPIFHLMAIQSPLPVSMGVIWMSTSYRQLVENLKD